MKKILVDARCIFDSGIGIYLQEILMQLGKSECQLSLIVRKEQEAKVRQLDIRISEFIPVEFGQFSLKNLFSFYQIIKRNQYYFAPSLSIMPLSLSCTKIVTIHDLCPFVYKRFFGFRLAWSYWLLALQQVITANKVIAISNFTRNELIRVYGSWLFKKITVIPNGLSRRFELTSDEGSSRVTSKPFILCVGNVKPHKNIINFINFFTKHEDLKTKYKLVIVGQNEGFKTGVEQELINDEYCEFTGYVSDEELYLLYKNASFFVFPSLYEGFGLPLLEAMSFDIDILASDIPVFKEIAGDSIEYFDPITFDGLYSAIMKIEQMPSENRYKDVLEYYSWSNAQTIFIRDVLK
ncbi:MAG: glycosyltransferase family 4 protein [Psychrobium sp.]